MSDLPAWSRSTRASRKQVAARRKTPARGRELPTLSIRRLQGCRVLKKRGPIEYDHSRIASLRDTAQRTCSQYLQESIIGSQHIGLTCEQPEWQPGPVIPGWVPLRAAHDCAKYREDALLESVR